MATAEAVPALWWLQVRQAVDVCQEMSTVEVNPSVGSSRLTIQKC